MVISLESLILYIIIEPVIKGMCMRHIIVEQPVGWPYIVVLLTPVKYLEVARPVLEPDFVIYLGSHYTFFTKGTCLGDTWVDRNRMSRVLWGTRLLKERIFEGWNIPISGQGAKVLSVTHNAVEAQVGFPWQFHGFVVAAVGTTEVKAKLEGLELGFMKEDAIVGGTADVKVLYYLRCQIVLTTLQEVVELVNCSRVYWKRIEKLVLFVFFLVSSSYEVRVTSLVQKIINNTFVLFIHCFYKWYTWWLFVDLMKMLFCQSLLTSL